MIEDKIGKEVEGLLRLWTQNYEGHKPLKFQNKLAFAFFTMALIKVCKKFYRIGVKHERRKRKRKQTLRFLQNKYKKQLGYKSYQTIHSERKRIVNYLSREYGLSKKQILQKGKGKENIVEARHVLQSLMYYHVVRNKTLIGNLTNRDHASVIYGIKTVENHYDVEPKFRKQYDKIKNSLGY